MDFSSVVGAVAVTLVNWYHLATQLSSLEEEVLAILVSLDTNKAAGINGISSKILRAVAPGISVSLSSLFNASLGSGHLLLLDCVHLWSCTCSTESCLTSLVPPPNIPLSSLTCTHTNKSYYKWWWFGKRTIMVVWVNAYGMSWTCTCNIFKIQ